jgi:Cu+-exporting ATPase
MATKTLNLPVGGMTCGNCARGVQQTLTRLPGVVWAAVDHVKACAQVEYDPQLVQPERLAAAIRELGYQATL